MLKILTVVAFIAVSNLATANDGSPTQFEAPVPNSVVPTTRSIIANGYSRWGVIATNGVEIAYFHCNETIKTQYFRDRIFNYLYFEGQEFNFESGEECDRAMTISWLAFLRRRAVKIEVDVVDQKVVNVEQVKNSHVKN